MRENKIKIKASLLNNKDERMYHSFFYLLISYNSYCNLVHLLFTLKNAFWPFSMLEPMLNNAREKLK